MLISSRLDYWNSLYLGIGQSSYLIFSWCTMLLQYITPLTNIPALATSSILFVHKAMHGLTPEYITELPYSTSRPLISSLQQLLPAVSQAGPAGVGDWSSSFGTAFLIQSYSVLLFWHFQEISQDILVLVAFGEALCSTLCPLCLVACFVLLVLSFSIFPLTPLVLNWIVKYFILVCIKNFIGELTSQLPGKLWKAV